jgi:hypothetical protein
MATSRLPRFGSIERERVEEEVLRMAWKLFFDVTALEREAARTSDAHELRVFHGKKDLLAALFGHSTISLVKRSGPIEPFGYRRKSAFSGKGAKIPQRHAMRHLERVSRYFLNQIASWHRVHRDGLGGVESWWGAEEYNDAWAKYQRRVDQLLHKCWRELDEEEKGSRTQ